MAVLQKVLRGLLGTMLVVPVERIDGRTISTYQDYWSFSSVQLVSK
jgi:hypothetical protein